MRFDRLVLVSLLLVLPGSFWPGSTSYDSIKFTILALAAACWLGSLAWRLGTGRPVVLAPPGLSIAGISLLVVLSVSALNAHHTGLVWRTVSLTALWLAVVVQTVAAADSVSRLRSLLAAGVIAGTAVCLYALAQMAGWAPGAPAESGFPPGIGSLGNQNYVSGLAAVLVWPSVVLWSSRSTARRMLAIAGTAILAVTVMFAQAAGPVMAITGAALLTGPTLVMLRRGMTRRIPPVFGTSLLLLAVAGSVLMADALRTSAGSDTESPALHRRLFLENHGDVRRTDWLVARDMFLSSPWTGRGAGNYAALWPATRARLQADPHITGLADHEPLAARAHNDLFQFLGETGAVGALWFATCVGLAVVFWRRRWRALPDDRTRTPFLLLTAGVLTAGLHAMVSFPLHLPATALMLALFIGLMASPVFAAEVGAAPVWKGVRVLAVLPALAALLLAAGAVEQFVGDLHTAAGQRHYSAGRMGQATARLEEGLARRKWPAENLLYLGLTKVATGHPEQARTFLSRSINEKPTFEGYLALAELSIDQRRFADAAALLTVVQGCEPFMTFRYQAVYLRGLSELRQGHKDRSRQLFRALLQEDPGNQRAWLALGYQEVLDGNPGQGRIYYRRALEIIERKLREARHDGTRAAGEIVRLDRHRATARKALDSLNQP